MRNRLYCLINLAGLALSLALVITVFSYTGAQRRISRAVPDYENTYAVTWEGDGLLCYGVSDRLSGLPEAEAMTMFSGAYEDCVCEFGEKTFLSDVMCSDAEFFDFFDIEFLKGSPDRFSVTGAFLSESFARRFAEDDDLEGKQIRIDGDIFTVAGIFKDFGKGLLRPADINIRQCPCVRQTDGRMRYPLRERQAERAVQGYRIRLRETISHAFGRILFQRRKCLP